MARAFEGMKDISGDWSGVFWEGDGEGEGG